MKTVNERATGRRGAYNTWRAMNSRCRCKSHSQYFRYGGAGIAVCERWLSFENFYQDMGGRPKRRTLDRLDSHGDYSPKNCRWASPSQQQRNKSNSLFLTKGRSTFHVEEWADRLGIRAGTIRVRLFRGWSVERALTP